MSKVASNDIYPKQTLAGTHSYPCHCLMTLLSDIMTYSSRAEVIAKLPRWLEHSCGVSISLWQPHTDSFDLKDALFHQPLTAFPPIHNTFTNESFCESVTAAKIVLPLLEGDDLLATLSFEHDSSCSEAEYKTMLCLAQGVSSHLTMLAEQMKITTVTALSQHLLTAQDSSTIAERALALLLQVLDLEEGAILAQRGSSFQTLARRGHIFENTLQGGLPIKTSWLEQAYECGQPMYFHPTSGLVEREAVDGITSFAVYPLSDTLPSRLLLLLGSSKQRGWFKADKELLRLACQIVSLALRSTEAQARLKTLLTLQRHSLAESETQLLQEIMLAALQTVPGAEAGSLLLKEGKRFHFRAAVGCDFNTLKAFSFRAAEMLYWQHPELLDWNSSEPRIFSKKDAEQKRILEGATLSPAFREVGRVDEIQSNLYFPIVYQGQVLAVLNLDNFQNTDAFAEDSLEAARMFGPPVAVLLRERRYRYLLQKDSLTDPLTNLANRRAFDQAITREVKRAQTYQSTFSLLLLDLGNFKLINDKLGHARGDAVLIEVAKTLQKVTRASDLRFRWGGDEFAVLLPDTAYEGAIDAARRCARAIKRISKDALPVTVHIGVATYPSCATDMTTLLRLADERLYEAKGKDITVFLAQSFIESQGHID